LIELDSLLLIGSILFLEIVFWIVFIVFGFRLGYRWGSNYHSKSIGVTSVGFMPVNNSGHLLVFEKEPEQPNTEETVYKPKKSESE